MTTTTRTVEYSNGPGTRTESVDARGLYDRDDGPARVDERPDGRSEHWYRHGEMHREDGPAVVSTWGADRIEIWAIGNVEIASRESDDKGSETVIQPGWVLEGDQVRPEEGRTPATVAAWLEHGRTMNARNGGDLLHAPGGHAYERDEVTTR